MLLRFKDKEPQIAEDVFIAPTAVIIGDVVIEAGCSVWFGAVIRGDSGAIRIGPGSNVQDNVVIHVNGRANTIIGANVTLGHGVILEGCVIEDGVMVGMNATILSGATVGAGTVIAAGAVVLEESVIPAGVLAAGVPAKVRGPLTLEIQQRLAAAPAEYRKYAQLYPQEVEIIEESSYPADLPEISQPHPVKKKPPFYK